MVSKRLEDRINDLMAKAIATTDPDELEKVISNLREALSEHIQKVRKMAATKLPRPRKRKTDNIP